MMAPGASALSRIPAPAQFGDTAVRRTQWLTAILDAAYMTADAPGPSSRTERTALAVSRANSARMVRPGTAGVVVVELLASTTTLARSAAASAGRHASSSSTT